MWRKLHHLLQNEPGQALPLFGLGLIVFLGFVAMSIDVGRYMWARTQMQSAVDAASLAGAQSLPNGTTTAGTYATQYWTTNSTFIRSQGQNVSFTNSYSTDGRTITSKGSADIPTWFAKFFGVSKWHVEAQGSASMQALDIALVLDISGSMCFTSYPQTEDTSNVFVMSPGRTTPTTPSGTSPAYKFPKLASAITSTTQTTITLNDVRIFASTSSSANTTNFGSSWNSTTPYWQKDPDGSGSSNGARAGIIQIDNELMQITAVNTTNNTLTVTRGVQNKETGVTTTKTTHAVNAEVWALRGGGAQGGTSNDYCWGASYNTPTVSTNGPAQPFDDAMTNAKYFISLFNSNYDQISLTDYSSTASTLRSLTTNYSSLNSSIDSILFPTGGTNTAHGIALGKLTLDASTRSNTTKFIVLLTDGVPTHYCSNSSAYTSASTSCSSTSPGTPTCSNYSSNSAFTQAKAQAAAAKTAKITVYTIGLGTGALDCVLSDIASAGGGSYIKAPTTADLDAAFLEIAKKTRISLTQ